MVTIKCSNIKMNITFHVLVNAATTQSTDRLKQIYIAQAHKKI